MKIYIAGKVTGENESDVQNKFFSAKIPLIKQGHKVMSPAVLTTNAGFEHGEYIHICYAMIDVCDAIYMLSDWQKSKGARMELQYACDHQKEIMYQDEATKETGFPIVYGHPAHITDLSRLSSYEGEKPDEMTTDEKEKLCRLVEEHLQISICYDSCEPWKKGILKIAEELK